MNKFDTEVVVEHIKLPGLTVLAYKCFKPIEFSYHVFLAESFMIGLAPTIPVSN